MHDVLLTHQEALGADDLIGYAQQLGLDVDRLASDLFAHVGAARVAEDEARRARERAEDAARRARHLAEEQERRAQGGTGRPFDVWAAATAPGPGGGTGRDSGGIRPRNSAGTPGPRTRDAVEFDRESASGTVDGGVGESGVAGTDNVDHDRAGPPAAGTGDARDGEV